MRFASVIGFLLVAGTIHAQDFPPAHDTQGLSALAKPDSLMFDPGKEALSETSIPDGLSLRAGAQPLVELPKPAAYEGQWIATGEQLPAFGNDLIITERKEDGRNMWHVERVNSCSWCGPSLTWKQAAFDKKATSLWALRSAMFVTDLEITHHSPCFVAHRCVEADPLLGQTRAQGYAVASALTALDWWITAYLRKGNRTYHVGGYKHWYLFPIIGQTSSGIGIIANLARWNR